MNKYVLIVVVALLAIAIMRRRGQSVPSLDVDEGPVTEADIDRLILEGRKIDAIKVYRRLKSVDLKDAKDAVDARERKIKNPGA
jgi:ribosomal protein L7/L12